ncbi:hypothetical protein E9S_02834 [Moraxella catarrhalis BC7]|nr:hypothetical protein E9S_02834 [Moraxella catarrhalis BC7]EGE27487.1 hypothetical protein EA1_02452 [Moraxella catarrhalis O35E]
MYYLVLSVNTSDSQHHMTLGDFTKLSHTKGHRHETA